MKKLSLEQIIEIHETLVEQTGGLQGIRDMLLLESALYSPFQTFDGEHLYPTMLEKFSRMSFSIISNHPFIDGNKRIGLLVLLTNLELNSVKLHCTDEDLIKLGLDLAT